jgi:hypothetical protein
VRLLAVGRGRLESALHWTVPRIGESTRLTLRMRKSLKL